MKINLKEQSWKVFFLENFIEIKSGKDISEVEKVSGLTPYISATAYNNGINDFVSNINKSLEKDCLSVNRTGSVGYSFYHGYPALFSNNCRKLKIKIGSNKYKGLCLSTLITSQKEKYSYGYILGTERLKRQKILVPVNESGEPNFHLLENYIKVLKTDKQSLYIDYCLRQISHLNYKEILPLQKKQWDEFFIHDIAEIDSGQDIYESERISGNTPYISSTSQKNGISHFVNNTNKTLEKECLSVNRNGSVGYCFYHSYQGLYSNDCRKLRPKFKSKHAGLFISNQITKQKDKYSYGYKMGTARLRRQKIMLPINHNNQPDYEYMEQYMINLEFMKRNQYLAYLKAQQQ